MLASPRPVTAQTIIDEWDSVKAPPAPPLKPVTIDAKSTGLLMMDFNRNSCLPDRRPRCANALPKLKKLLADARAHGMPVVHTLTNEKATVADISPELAPAPGEPVLTPGLDKFVTGEIAKYFKDKGVTTVILAGTSANGAVLFTVGGAVVAGFKAIVPVDGMPAETPYQEQFSVWNIAYGPRLREGATLTKMDMIKF
jgi:nicotinamidase-related amidase